MVARSSRKIENDHANEGDACALPQTLPCNVDRLVLSRFERKFAVECVQEADLMPGNISSCSSDERGDATFVPPSSGKSMAAQSRGNRRRVKQRERRRLYKSHPAEQDLIEEAPTEYHSTGSESQDSGSMSIGSCDAPLAGERLVMNHQGQVPFGELGDSFSACSLWQVPPTRLATLAPCPRSQAMAMLQ
mmetsp:Transcript_29055/g.52933  ORF Transcript_29055/g.52933 Transcript_29055/m.52933 type:complete len:190 (+) Transcript_29055:83-652(+)